MSAVAGRTSVLTRLEGQDVTFTLSPTGLKVDAPKRLLAELTPLIKEHRAEIIRELNWKALRGAVSDIGKLGALHELFELRCLEITALQPTREMKATLLRQEEAGNTPVRLLLDGTQVWANPQALPTEGPERSLFARRFYDAQVKRVPGNSRFVELLADVANALTEWGLEDPDEPLVETREKLKAALAKTPPGTVRSNLLGQWAALDDEAARLSAAGAWWRPDDGRHARIKVPVLTAEAEALATRKARCAWALYYCEATSGEVETRVWLSELEAA